MVAQVGQTAAAGSSSAAALSGILYEDESTDVDANFSRRHPPPAPDAYTIV